MKKIKTNDNFIKNNLGSTLITVIVAIAFVTILTSIILGTTLMNMKMKGIDRHTKDDFYYSEKALNDIYTGIGQEMSVIVGEEYDKAFNKVGMVDSSSNIDYGLAEESEKEFRKNFITRAKAKFPTDADELKAKLSGFITDSSRNSTVESVGAVVIEKKDGTLTTPSDSPYKIRIRDLQISSTDSTGYQSVISTDIIIYIPSTDFFGSNADITDYGLIANKGIYINGNATITGNVYGGIHPKSEYATADRAMYSTDTDYNAANLYGGINIKGGTVNFDGNYIVSKGNINLFGKSAGIKVGDATVADANLPNIWFDSLKTIKKSDDTFAPSDTGSTVELYSNTYALNDLELNAEKSNVKIAGNYYGYNDKTLLNPDKMLLGYMEKRDDAESSAIIINGSSCTLDMKDINTFVLMGKAYVDFTTNGGTVETDATPVVATAEGVALKTNQQLYLVPIDFLNCPNPIGGADFTSTYSGKFDISTSKPDLRKWFGYKYVIPKDVIDDDSTDSDVNKAGASDENAYKEIYKTYKVTLGSGSDSEVVYYAYLDFNDKVWIPQIDASGKVTGYVEDTSGKPIGSGGFGPGTGATVSSKTAFFAEIMSSIKPTTLIEEEEENAKIQPSAYRLRERIEKSMKYSYFDLQKCVIGDSTNPDEAILYAKNAIVSYDKAGGEIQSNLVGNTVGMVRFADYPQKMFHRYQWLCTQLDGREKVNLKDDPGSPVRDIDSDTSKDEWKASSDSDAPPLSHFVMIDAITSTTDTGSASKIAEANAAGLKRTAYGDCVIKHGDFVIDSSTATVGTTFKGIAIVDGDITIKNGYNAYGLLMATGTITVEGDSTITYDKGLIQARIEKEMQLVKQDGGVAADAYKDYYLISYLSKTTRMAGTTSSSSLRLYNVTPGSAIKDERIEADYNEFVQYENWKKGPR